jgi:tetratricopeptide (TPR) repeat protein
VIRGYGHVRLTVQQAGSVRASGNALLLLVSLASLCVLPSLAQNKPGSAARFAVISAKADAARDAERLDEAIPLYKTALSIRPAWTEGWWSLGTILYDQNSYPGAAHAFRRLLSYDPKNGTAHLMLGLCEYQLDLDDSALQDLEKAKELGVRKDDQLPQVLLYHEAMLELRKGQYESALEALRFLVKEGVRSEELDAALGMGVLLLRPKNAPAEGSPERQVVLRAGRAEELSLAKKLDEAKQSYAALAQEFPQFPNVHYAYGRFLLTVDDPEDAVTQFEQEIKNNPGHTRARLQIAVTHYRVDSAAGIPYAQEVVKLDPNYPFGHYLLGLLYYDSGDAAQSIPELETAARMVPREAQFQFALGNAYARAGRKEEAARARALFRRLKEKTPTNGEPTTYGEQRPLRLDSTGSAPVTEGNKRP